MRAAEYIQQLIPAIGGLAVRAAVADKANALIRWEHPHGELVFIPPVSQMNSKERAHEALARLLRSLAGTEIG